MAVGYVKEINGELTPVVTAGTSCGKVNKQEYACDKNYAIALTENVGGEGYLGITCCCPLLYNPATGKLSVCYVDACSEYARVTECVKLRESSNNVDYPVPFTCYTNAESCQPIYVGGSITYNPASSTLTVPNVCGTASRACSADTVSVTPITGSVRESCILLDQWDYPGKVNTSCLLRFSGSKGLITPEVTVADTMSIDNNRIISVNSSYACKPYICFCDGCISTNVKISGNCFTGTACSSNVTCAVICYNNYCMDSYTSNVDYTMVLSAGAKCLGRSGSCSVSFNPSTGVLKASTFCGSLSGNATTATGTSNYNCYCLDYYTGSMDRPIVISGTDSTTQSTVVTSLGRSTCCPLTFNPNTGVLRSAIFCGNLSGNATGTSSYDHYCLSYFCGNADRQVVLSDANTTPAGTVTNLGRSTNCLLTFNPANGVMCRYGSCMFGYGIMLPSANGGTTYALIDNGSASGNVIEGRAYTNAFAIAKNCAGAANCIYRHGVDNYGTPAIGHISNTSTCFWLRYGAWIGPELFAKNPIKLVCTTTTAPSGITFCNSISEAACAVCAIDATRAQYHCRIGYTDNYNFDVGLQNGIDCRTDYTYVSACCRLRYRNTTGNLCITQSDGATVAGTVTAANGCFTNTLTTSTVDAASVIFNKNLCNTCSSTTIGYQNVNRLPGSLTIGYNASSDVCGGVTWTSTIDMDNQTYGRHGRVYVTIPSCNVTCDTYKGLRHIINCVINNGICNCTWSIYSTVNVPNARFAVYGYWWDDGGSADGYRRYSPGRSRHGSISTPGYILTTESACSGLSINQMLYNCCYNICISGVGEWNATATNTWVCGAQLEIVF